MKRPTSDRSSKICTKIKLERLKRKITQEELSNKAGISTTGLGRIERAEVSPTITTLERLANAMDMDFMELVDISKVNL